MKTKNVSLSYINSVMEDDDAVNNMLDDMRHAEDAHFAELEAELEEGTLFHILEMQALLGLAKKTKHV